MFRWAAIIIILFLSIVSPLMIIRYILHVLNRYLTVCLQNENIVKKNGQVKISSTTILIRKIIYLSSFLEYFILKRLKIITSTNMQIRQYQAMGAKSKQYKRITPTIPCVRRFFQSVRYIFKPSIIFIQTPNF